MSDVTRQRFEKMRAENEKIQRDYETRKIKEIAKSLTLDQILKRTTFTSPWSDEINLLTQEIIKLKKEIKNLKKMRNQDD